MIKDYVTDLKNIEIIEEIGHGSCGKVYLVQDIKTQTILAAKVYKNELKDTREQISFFQEITILLKIRNPAVLAIFGFNMMNFEGQQFPTIITNYMRNGSLRYVLNEYPGFPWSKKYIILLGIAEGMKYLHSQNIIHFDLKPDNILLDEFYYPHICDFGESELFQSNLSEIKINKYVGSPIYMAHEIFLKESCTFKIDVFSFSMIAYELFSGQKLYEGFRSILQLALFITRGRRPNMDSINNQCIKFFLSRCWSKNPQDRPTFNEIVDELKRPCFRNYMNADDNEVEQYLRLFGDSLQQKSKMNQNIICKPNFNNNNETNKNETHNKIKKSDNINDDLNANDAFDLAMKFKNDESVSTNKFQAAHYFKLAADKGSTNAMIKLAYMLRKGDGIEMNKQEALKYYKMAMDNGSDNAMYHYAYMLSIGEGCEINIKEAAKYFKIAANNGLICAIIKYASMLLNGNGVAINSMEASRYYKMAADRGNSNAMYNYATILYNSEVNGTIKGTGVDINRKEAIKYFKMAADNGNIKAVFYFASLLKNDEGIVLDKPQKARYFKMAADNGDCISMYEYANMLRIGDGIAVNKTEASLYFKKSAEKGNKHGMFNYALMMEKGDGIPVNIENALYYYKILSNKGNVKAMFKCANIICHNENIEINKSEAAKYYKLAADHGHIESMLNYAIMLHYGDGIRVNETEANRYCKMAVEYGNKNAISLYEKIKKPTLSRSQSDSRLIFKSKKSH